MSSSAPSLSAPLPAQSTPADPRRGWLLFCLFALYFIWGSTYLAIRWALEGGFPPLRLGGLRFTLAGAILYGVLRLRGMRSPTRREWMAGAFTGFLLLVVGNGCVAYAQQWVSSGVAALVVGSMPLWAALFGGLYEGQWPGRAERWGLALGFFGIALLNQGGELGGRWLPVVALLFAPLAWAFGSIWARHHAFMPQGLMATATQMLCSGAALLVLSAATGEHMLGMPDARGLASFFYLVAFGSLIAFSAYGYLLRHARPALATSYAYVNPMVAVLLGVLLGGETPGPHAFVAMTAILAAVVLITRRAPAKVRREASAQASTPSTS
ncbi:drug/metabolite exporter YedA [Hyalangium rubrum]|uniref:Drug/metabolite exporter YedA n=1 Tax=Hyalangium rubrum TaxID=3103134 RepID=A0ABU5H6M0_9BACT|nr:drug/metabolite exporter YedA [Hyalangium sp. s54d21]MDY7227740.1 drug/metabolite exporter YedA [Hyalangium sp. s54d21]